MKKGKLSPKDRKRLARLSRECQDLIRKGCKADGSENCHEQRFNDRFDAKYNEIVTLEQKNI